jgi:RNA recognition motif-containing protein
MARLWINNLSPDVGDNDVTNFLQRYGFPPHARINAVADEQGRRRAVVLTYEGIDEQVLRNLQPRVHGVYFMGSTLHVQVAPPARRG